VERKACVTVCRDVWNAHNPAPWSDTGLLNSEDMSFIACLNARCVYLRGNIGSHCPEGTATLVGFMAEVQLFIQAVTRFPPKRAANRRPVEPMGKYETTYQSRHTSCAMAAMKVRRVLCSYHADIVSEHERGGRPGSEWDGRRAGHNACKDQGSGQGLGHGLTPREK
jgi:hypothetical protein